MDDSDKSTFQFLGELTHIHGRDVDPFRIIFETHEDCIFVKDRELKYTHVNPAVEKVFGVSRSAVIGRTDEQIFGPEAAVHVRDADLRVLAGEIVEREENIRIGDQARTFRVVKVPLRDQTGEIVGLHGFARDVTERRNAELALRQSQQMLDKILSASPQGISYAEKGRLKWTNRALANIFGYRDECEYLGKPVEEFYSDEQEYKRVVRIFFRCLQEGVPAELEALFKKKDGSLFQGLLKISALDSSSPASGTIATISDISARRRAEEELRESEERYRVLAQNSLTGIYIHQEGRFVYVNDRLASMLGYTPDEMLGRNFWEFVHPRDRSLVKARGLARYLGVDAFRHYEFLGLCKDGQTKWLEVLAVSIPFRGEPASMGNIADITERKRAEEAVRESQEHYRTLVEESFDGIFIQKGSQIVFANKRLYQLLGYEDGELEGKEHWVVYHPDYREITRERAAARMRGEAVPSRYEVRLLRKDGSSFEAEINAKEVKFGGEPGVQVWLKDITSRKNAEKDRLRIDKLESLGILAGGIAHDFNNILTAVLGNISLAALYCEPTSKAREKLAVAERAATRARALTQQLLTFSKGGTPIKKAVLISEMIRESAEFALRGSNVSCSFFFADDLWPVEVDPGQLSHVLNNLFINADQAMPEGGNVIARAENVTITRQNGLTALEGKYVRITIEDTGCGIPDGHLTKIFDPYFTTKPKGTGLGLATAYSIIKGHRGLITVESSSERGSKFHVYLLAAPGLAPMPKEVEHNAVSGRGRILLMDDEESIRDVAAELLSMLGYEVASARDGTETIAMYESALKSPAPFDAVIMDLTIPGGVGGREAVQRLREMNPQVKAIVSSGYSNDPVMAEYRKYGFDGVVAKPYNADELSEALQKLLGRDH